jgi:DNA invertase Pin-like site-specific DNA recombinase
VIAFSYTRFSNPTQALGHSEERQLKDAREYARQHGFTLDESVFADKGKSGYRGKNITDGALGEFIRRVEKGEIRCEALIVENPDRMSRQKFSDCYPTYQRLLNAGVEIHFLSIRDVLKPDHIFVDLLRIGVEIDKANAESRLKSERCGKAWKQKRDSANGKAAMSARAPKWCRAEKGKPITLIPERAKIVRQIFQWAALGVGQYQICDRLIAKGVPAWGPVYKGRPPKWNPFYIATILTNRATIGEYQPFKSPKDQRRVKDGDPVIDYYPKVVPLSLFQKVQEIRRTFAQSKFGETLHAGKDKFSTRNLFRKLVWDVQNGVPMVFKKYDGWSCLVSTWRKDFREHRIRYKPFEEAMLKFLSEADWRALSQSEMAPRIQELEERREALAKEIDDNAKVLARYEAILDDPESNAFERVKDKYKAAAAHFQRLIQQRSTLEAEIAVAGNNRAEMANTKCTEFVATDDEEFRTKLRLLIAQRVSKIQVHFNPHHKVARVTFVNGAIKFVLIQGKGAIAYDPEKMRALFRC